MRANEFLSELRKKKVVEPKAGDTTEHDYNPGWQDLNWMKEQAARMGQKMTGMYQLFMPRPSVMNKTNRDRRMDNLANSYAWRDDDPSKLKPNYAKWQGDEPEPEEQPVQEAAPILIPGKSISPPGNNKPQAHLWTSSARKLDNGTYTSDWVRYVYNSNKSWMSPTGYLYRVKPNGLILDLNYDQDAERLKWAFQNLGSAKPDNPDDTYRYLAKDYPWDQIVKHFDAVHHYPYSGNTDFLYGWDCESTAWFNTDQLELIGEVKINQFGLDPYGDDD
jgi:hypothetical protein